MNPIVKKMYTDAMNSTQFEEDMKKQDPMGYAKPSIFSSDMEKHLYACAYYGWMLGKGIYNRKNYE